MTALRDALRTGDSLLVLLHPHIHRVFGVWRAKLSSAAAQVGCSIIIFLGGKRRASNGWIETASPERPTMA